MQAATKTGIELWVSRRALMATALAAWTGGIVLAGAAGWYTVHHHRAAPDATVETTASDSTDAIESPATLVLPAEVVVAPRPHDNGVTQMQKP
jgi:multidrug efflux pump subunit AcrA (membrane-fusion protein)